MAYLVLALFLLVILAAARLITMVELMYRIRKYGLEMDKVRRTKIQNYIALLAVAVLLIPTLIYFLLME